MTETLPQIREAFQTTFQAYVREGLRMRDILISTQPRDDDHRRKIIERQQEHLSEAAKRYENARAAYVTYVLEHMSASGGAVFP